MRIIPAIDLMEAKVVRLTQGKPKFKKEYSDSPLEVAKIWKSQGVNDLHIIDLDKALGKGNNLRVISEIAKKVKIDIEVGGGIRTSAYIKKLLDLGVKRVILGTKAYTDSKFFKKAIKDFKDYLVVSIDLKGKNLAYRGWQKTLNLDWEELIKRLSDSGINWLIYTDVLRDGTLKGLNFSLIKKIKKVFAGNLIVSGGVGSLEDLKKVKSLDVWGVIVGKALYEGKFSLKQALRV
ncbi:MAG TPA: 1-(5-phosphoribosyl)-5-[(5-phosphoribosylamino)methylideneamino]imidazole-4-carboxamide isomerase [Candidatus Omnitrophica bacterium]|nr:MAG: 1-(5-phosphoribosyl)-5-[(5-phosphoribosylamino)methylideneamino]imidazole-4-carboxamide isomerase [Candidatus Omnitrophota bacterium]RKY44316.1 MAG: 1-(5-phosphoribosyl)-5-[(5-phosphoribosylamino)methylideneamino]imidazole-4-carboxamide isomerase [Candidatus Omnitrophota bacterium]HEC68742.1 1-(5-phosphoribosyl)-5-[(5-phosphoribosylamino)methylideneamino]imidazole-4-carboxamide isomerase [Candidatus Omnitrophota bacterium]